MQEVARRRRLLREEEVARRNVTGEGGCMEVEVIRQGRRKLQGGM